MTDIPIELDENLLGDSVEYESWLINIESSITFRGKNLSSWTEELNIPTLSIDSELSIQELELLNQRLINLISIVMDNLALSRAAANGAKLNYELGVINQKRILCDIAEQEGRRIPSKDTLNDLASERCSQLFRQLGRSELVFEYWNTQSYKLKNLDSRITSLSFAKRT